MFSALRALTIELRSVFLRLLAYIGGIAVVCLLAAGMFRTAPVIAATELTPKAEWVAVDQPNPALQLTLTDRPTDDPQYSIRRHPNGGRKDTVTFGEAGQRYLMIELHRPGAATHRFGDPATEIAAITEHLGRVGKIKPGPDIETKFGPFAYVNFAIRPEREINQCAGFVRVVQTPRMQISGIVCNEGEVLVDREALACALDRLTLNAAGRDAKIGAVFARAELKRKFCGQRAPLHAQAPKRPEANAPLKLRGRIAAR